METDKLKKINKENICDVLQALKRDWPSSIHIYYFIWIQMKWLEANSNVKSINVYRYGKPEQELFVASVHYLLKDTMINNVMVHSQIKDDEKVKQLLLETDGIDWSVCLVFEGVIEKDIPIIKQLCKIKNKPCFSDGLFIQMWLPPEKQQALTITKSRDMYIGELTKEHVPRVNDMWHYKFPRSEQLARDVIVYNKGMGLFRKADDKLVAWSLMQHYGALGMLYTDDNERGKGYGKLISLALTKYLVDIEIDPYLYVNPNNTHSFSIYKKIGFEITDKVSWIFTSKLYEEFPCDKN